MGEKDILAAVLSAAFIEPCHVTGTHDPTHTLHYMCNIQKAQAFDRIIAALGMKEPMRQLHAKGCYFCHDKKGDKKDRAELLAWSYGKRLKVRD